MKKIAGSVLLIVVMVCCGQDSLVNEAAVWRKQVFQIHAEIESAVDCSGTELKPGILKIITVVQSNCGACIVNLQNWEALMAEEVFSPKYIRYYFLIQSDDDFMNFQFMQEQGDLIEYPLIIDKSHMYFESMGFSPDERLQTFLLDDKNEVLEIGSPIVNEKTKELYVAKIKDHYKKSIDL